MELRHADVRAGLVDAVIVSELSRLGRNTRLVLHLVEELTRNGVVFVSCAQLIDTTTPTGQFMLSVFAALSQLERDQIAERTRGAMAHLNRTTGDAGGRTPFGYLRGEHGAMDVDPISAETVRRIFQLHRRGLSLREIAEKLQAEERPTPRGNHWHYSAVRIILANREKYRGGKRGDSQHAWPRILVA